MHVPCGQNKVEAVLCLFFPFTSPSLLNLHLWLLQIQKHFFLSVSLLSLVLWILSLFKKKSTFNMQLLAVTLMLWLCLSLSDCLAFCTEPVFASLSNVMGHWDNLPSPMPNDIKEYKLYDVETKYGLLQVRVHTGLVTYFRNVHKYRSVDL